MQIPFFGKKKAEEPRGRGYVPTDRARELMSRGFSELDTIDVLRREGFSPDEIDSSLTQVVKEGVVSNAGGGGFDVGPGQPAPTNVPQDFDQPYQAFRQQRPAPSFPPRRESAREERGEERMPGLKLPTIEELQPARSEVPTMPETSLPEEYYQGYPTEEYIDYVIQERTQDMVERLNEFTIRNKELESRIMEMNERIRELGKIRSSEDQQVVSKIEGLSESMTDIDTRMANLEKAFKETLPALIESVRALSDLVQRLKREG